MQFCPISNIGYDDCEAGLLWIDDRYPGIGRVELEAGEQPFDESSEDGDTRGIGFTEVNLFFRHEGVETTREGVVRC